MLIAMIGFLAAFTSTVSLIPQIYKTYTTKSSKDLSYIMLINFFITSVLWITYGIMILSAAVYIANIIMLFFSIALMILKYIYD